MFYNFKNLEIFLEEQKVFANSLSIDLNASLVPVFVKGDRHTQKYSQSTSTQGSVRLSYYLTGIDNLKEFTRREDLETISGNFGGLLMQSGYLSKYSLSAAPNGFAVINAEMMFFDDLKGEFSPTFVRDSETPFPANFSDSPIVEASGNKIGRVSNENLISYNYDYIADINPIYVVDERTGLSTLTPYRVVFGPKQVQTSITTDILSGNLPMDGLDANLTLTIHHRDGTILDSFKTDGVLNSKTISTASNEIIASNYSIIQHTVGDLPEILGFSPVSGNGGDIVIISGENLINTTQVTFNGGSNADFVVLSDSEISGIVPENAIDGPITITNFVGASVSDDEFDFLSNPIIISGFTPISGFKTQNMLITGKSFVRIDSVSFNDGSKSANFSVVNSNTISLTIPSGVVYSRVRVSSSDYGETGISPYHYVPIPVISNFTQTGSHDDTILVFGESFGSGIHFGDSQPMVNNITGKLAQFADTAEEGFFRFQLPSTGNINGKIRVFAPSGVSVLSAQEFEAFVNITGISPKTGEVGDVAEILGQNFDEDLFYQGPGGNFIVEYNGSTGEFGIDSSVLLTGFVPDGATTGPVRIWRPDQKKYKTSFPFVLQNIPPFIDSVSPSTGSANDLIFINGSGFFDVQSIVLTGDSDGETLTTFSSDIFGEILSFNVPGALDTGIYSLTVNALVGSDSESDIFTINEAAVPTIHGVSGDPPGDGRLNLLQWGTFEESVLVESDVDITNTGDFDIRLTFPAIEGWKWDNANSGDAYPKIIGANSTETVTLSIEDSSYYTSEIQLNTGTWKGNDGFTGIALLSGNFIVP